jgi:bidirectional [NiFe] hydrogenase diaphorase subunit
MEVLTNSERLQKYRRMIIEMLFSEGNHICSVCVVNGHCELQSLAVALDVNHITLPYLNPHRGVDASHKRLVFDFNRCVLCTRCIRVCGEVEGAHTWDVMGRGIQSSLISDLKQPWGNSETCTSCGKCVQVCPTGALFEKGNAVGEMTKHNAFLVTLAKMRENGT